MVDGGNHQIHPPIGGDHNCTGGGRGPQSLGVGNATEAADNSSSAADDGPQGNSPNDTAGSIAPVVGCGVFGFSMLAVLIAGIVGLLLGLPLGFYLAVWVSRKLGAGY